MKTFLIISSLAAASFCCTDGRSATIPKTPDVVTAEPPCHNPVSIRKEATRIVLIQCDGSETEILFSEIMGPQGKPGTSGERGPSGSRGSDGKPAPEEKVIAYCRHDPVTHRNHTMQLKPSEIVTNYAGYYGALDFPGACGDWENRCSCDAPICRNENPVVHHYLTDGMD